MISVSVVLFMMFVHWIADFRHQTDEMARGKSKSNYWLSVHAGIYTAIMALGACVFIPTFWAWVAWVAFNGAAHWVTDYFTSRASSKYFAVGDYHNGFVVVGFDQWIHLACLMISTLYALS